MNKENIKIEIDYDDCGFAIKIGNHKYETDYCGFPNENEMETIAAAFRCLGYQVNLNYITDEE